MDIQPDAVWEGSADLKPGLGYPFGKDAATVRLTVTRGGRPLADQPVWLAAAEPAPLKLAQDKAEQGAQTLRLFSRSAADALPVPGVFLLEEKESPELVHLQAVEGEEGRLAAPLAHAHTRGRALLPAQQYRTDGQGRISVMLREAARLAVFCGGSIQYAEPVTDGEQAVTLRFE